MKKIKILNAWQIKLIITFLMLLNHLHYIYGLLPSNIDNLFIIISRCVAPMFAYLAVYGVIHTKNLKMYVIRLWIWSLIVTLGNYLISNLLFNSIDIVMEKEMYLSVGTNITFTLALGVSAISLIHYIKDKDLFDKIFYSTIVVFICSMALVLEWGFILIPFMMITYLFKDKLSYQIIGYLLLFIIAIVFNYEPLFISVLLLILLYNNKRGPNKPFNKYFFYLFYPIHLWIILIINYFLLK